MNAGISITSGVAALGRVDTRLLRDLGFQAVFVACSEDELRWSGEDVASFVRRAKNDGLEPYAVPWGYGRFVDPDPSIDSLYVRTHRETCQIDSRGRRLPKACPNHPRFLEWFASSMRTLAWLLECRGFVWDEPGFFHSRGAWSCRCSYCSRLFHASYGYEMPTELTDDVLEFRRQSVCMFLLAAAAAIQAVDRRLRSFVTPAARLPREQPFEGTEDPAALVRCSGVDGLCVIVPWRERAWDMEYAIRQALEGPGRVAHQHRKGCALWLMASPNPADRTLDAVEFAAASGADAVVLSDHSSLIESPGFTAMAPSLRALLKRVAA